MRNTFRSFALAAAISACAVFSAFAAPPGDVMQPINASQIKLEAVQAATLSASPALQVAVKDVNPVSLIQAAFKALPGAGLDSRLQSSEGTGFAITTFALSATPNAGLPAGWRT